MELDHDFKPELCISQDTARYALTSANLEVEKKRIVATNGHCAVFVEVTPGPEDKSGPVTKEQLEAARKASKKMSLPKTALAAGAGTVTIPGGQSFPRETGTDARFPDVDMVVPKYKEGDPDTVTRTIDPELLATLCKAMGITKGKGVRLTFSTKDTLAPVLCTPNTEAGPDGKREGEALGVCMPMGRKGGK